MNAASMTSSVSNLYAATRKELQRDFESATNLPDRPNYQRANAFLVYARRRAMQSKLP